MAKKSIEERIREIVAKRTSVRITGRKRCQHGFTVEHPDGYEYDCPTKREALTYLLVQARIQDKQVWKIKPAKAA